jgi:hypothetical protein
LINWNFAVGVVLTKKLIWSDTGRRLRCSWRPTLRSPC